jgi:hypothetical protein
VKCVAIIAATLLATSTANADAVFETYAGPRPVYADQVTNLIRGIFSKELTGNIARPELLIAALHHVPQPGVADTNLTSRALFDRLEIGVRDALTGTDFKAAATALDSALATAFANDGVYVAEPSARSEITRAQVQLGISRNRIGDRAGALDVFGDLARSSNGQPLHGYGPEAERDYGEALATLLRQPRGKLLISVSEPDAQIFVDEDGAGRGGTYTSDVIPGQYRVTVMFHAQALHYDIAVEQGHETKLEIDWDLETHLVVSPLWVGVQLAAPTDADHMARYARGLAHLTGRDQVALFGITEACDHVVVTGTRIDATSSTDQARTAHVILDNNHDRDILRTLARYLVLGQTSPTVFLPGMRDTCEPAPVVVAAPRPPQRHLWPTYAAGAAGALAIATGAYLVNLDGTGTCGAQLPVQCPRVYNTAPLGWSTVGAGVVAIGFGVVWLVTHHGRLPVQRVEVASF